jgi:hypothetical protein
VLKKQKCKRCNRGVLEPTFNGNEMRCLICGWGYSSTYTVLPKILPSVPMNPFVYAAKCKKSALLTEYGIHIEGLG